MKSTSFCSPANFRIPTAFAGLAVLVAISLALFRIVGLVQQRFFGWSLPKSAR